MIEPNELKIEFLYLDNKKILKITHLPTSVVITETDVDMSESLFDRKNRLINILEDKISGASP